MNKEREARREQFLIENYVRWNEEGMKLRERRFKHGYSLADVEKLLGTSASRIRSFEVGEPVSMAGHLKKSLELLYDHIELHNALFLIKKSHPGRELLKNE